MKLLNHRKLIKLITIFAGTMVLPVCQVRAASAAEMDRKANEALQKIYAQGADARTRLYQQDGIKPALRLGAE